MSLFVNSAVAETATASAGTPAASGDLVSLLIMVLAMVAIFYFLLIRPQKKKDKQVKDMLSALKVGDRVCTIGGLYGTIAKIKDDDITLAFGEQQTKVVMARWGIRSVENGTTENDNAPEV